MEAMGYGLDMMAWEMQERVRAVDGILDCA